jgi:hypothetical protein
MTRFYCILSLLGVGGAAILMRPTKVESACCYFSAKEKDVSQPGQKAFLTWDPLEKIETFTVQPKFEGNASDFGMVIPTPSQPKLHEMPREFFKELAVFTILEPMDLNKYKPMRRMMRMGGGMNAPAGRARDTTVRVLDAGIVGSLDYKVIKADRADDLFSWLKDNKYAYAGDTDTLDFYIKRKWFFTVMKIDPMQMKKRADGSFEGEVTPTRFNFSSDQLIYPLKITQISVRNQTEALLYIQAPQKMDLADNFSYEWTFTPLWSQAASYAIPERLTRQERAWQKYASPLVADCTKEADRVRQLGFQPANLEWAKKLTAKDMDVIDGTARYNRNAPKADIDNLKLLRGHLKEGQFVTKIRKVFTKRECDADLVFVPATLFREKDDMEYFTMLPTSPP